MSFVVLELARRLGALAEQQRFQPRPVVSELFDGLDPTPLSAEANECGRQPSSQGHCPSPPSNFYTNLLNIVKCAQGWNNHDVHPLRSCTLVDLYLFQLSFMFLLPGPKRLTHFVFHYELGDSGGISCRGVQRLTEGAKNASTEDAGTLNHLWGTDLYTTPNIKRQYLASVSQTSDSRERGDNDRMSFSPAEEMSPAINGSSVPSITYFWLVGD